MKVDLTGVPIQMKAVDQSVFTQVSQWANYAIRWLDKASPYLQNSWLAGLALVGINIVCFEIALSICRFIHYVLNQNAHDEVLSTNERNARALGLGAVFVATLGFANLFFCKMLCLPFSAGKVALISLPTAVCFLY